MNEDGENLVERIHRDGLARIVEQQRYERQLLETMFRQALARQQEEDTRASALVDRVHQEAVRCAVQNPRPQVDAPGGTHYTQLPEARPGSALAEEWNTYRREVGRLLAEGHAGCHVLVKDNEIVGIYATEREAYAVALQRWPGQAYFVHPIRPVEPFLRIRGVNYPWPHLRFR